MTLEEAVRRIDYAAEVKSTLLDLSGLGLKELPPQINKCRQLKMLVLGRWDYNKVKWVGNPLTQFPDDVLQLTNLQILRLAYNGITSIPEAIGQLSNLRELNLSANKIISIPEAFGQLYNLADLDLSYNKLTSIPESLGELSNLILLYLGGNQIREIPDALGKLSKLTELDFGSNQIRKIPDALGKLSKLTELHLGSNQIDFIPKVIGRLRKLEQLNVCRNLNIKFIPEELGKLSSLIKLDLSSTKITSIPEVIGQLSNLRHLDLSSTEIASIPKMIGQLSSLTKLYLGNNHITTIPEVIGQLSNLKELLLPNNQIAEIPQAIRSMNNLEKLDLRGNPVPVSPQILGHGQDKRGCGDLQTILDSYFHGCNQIIEIPEAIRSRENLEKLDLRNNPVPIFPEVLGYGQDDGSCSDVQTSLNYYFDTRNLALPELEVERQKIESEGYFDAETLQDARQRITASIVQRQGQAGFRRKLLIAYGGRCPITDCDVESAIEAAHIIPYQGTQTNHLTNGLPLRADIHTLFDLHLLSIRPDTNAVVIAPELVGTCYQYLADRKLTLPQDQKTVPNQNALSKHHETFLSKCKSGQLPTN